MTNRRQETRCYWMHNEEHDYYETACENAFSLTEGTPADNLMKFCPYCGSPIHEVELTRVPPPRPKQLSEAEEILDQEAAARYWADYTSNINIKPINKETSSLKKQHDQHPS